LQVVSLIMRDVMTYSQYLFVHWLMCVYVTGGKFGTLQVGKVLSNDKTTGQGGVIGKDVQKVY